MLKKDTADDTTLLSIQECTMELRASIGNQIRLVFYPITANRDDYDQDYAMPMSKSPCLRIRDVKLLFSLVFTNSFSFRIKKRLHSIVRSYSIEINLFRSNLNPTIISPIVI
mgnify:FL=1